MGLSGNVAMMFQAAPSVVVRAASSHSYRTVRNPYTAFYVASANETSGPNPQTRFLPRISAPSRESN